MFKLTKKDIRNISHFYNKIEKIIPLIKEKKTNKTHFILYGEYTGRIKQILYKKINFIKPEESMENADSIIRETFGEDFFNWISKEHNKITYL